MKYISKLILGFLLLTGTAFTACSTDQVEFTLTNNSNIDRTDEPIVLARNIIAMKTGNDLLPEERLPLPYFEDAAIPAQLDDLNGDGEWDELAFTLPISASESKNISIQFVDSSDYPEFENRTNVRFGVLENGEISNVETLTITDNELPVPLYTRFQMDGPAWENDKVGFRQYIDGRNGRDLFGKTSPKIVLDTVGISDDDALEDNYHVMLPWGRDILAVGNSLGLGGLALIYNDEVIRLGVRLDADKNNIRSTRYDLVAEGPVRSVFRLTYEGWETPSRTYDLTNTVTIWAGSYGHENEITLKSTNSSDTLAVGLVNIHNDNPPVLLSDSSPNFTSLYTHDKQTYDDEWFLGMGIIFPKANYLTYTKTADEGSGVTNAYLNLIELREDKTFKYHVLAGWELSDSNFAEAEYFDAFMKEELEKVSEPVSIK